MRFMAFPLYLSADERRPREMTTIHPFADNGSCYATKCADETARSGILGGLDPWHDVRICVPIAWFPAVIASPLRMARIFAAPCLGLALIAAYTMPARADDAPKQLHGKSVVVAWPEERMQRNVGEPRFRPVKAAHNLSIYVSTAGRVFNRMTNVTGAGIASNDQLAGSEGAGRVPVFDAQKMSMALNFRSGGRRQVDVEFKSAFDGCTAKVGFVRQQPGSPIMGFSGITKKWIEFQSVTPGEASCEISNGNVFGGD
jgi:hypothetical protein